MESDAQTANNTYYLIHIKTAKELSNKVENSILVDIFGRLAFLPVNILIVIAAYYKMKSNDISFRAAKAQAINYCYPPDEFID